MKVLFVSIAFPPKSDPECIQTAKYFYYLSKIKNLSIDVVTSMDPTLFMPVDNDLKKYDTGWSQKIEIRIPENKFVNFALRKFFPVFIDRPDSKYLFHWQWKKVVAKLLSKPDLIYSRSYPLSSTILAYKLKKYYDVPWVMHLSDPWFYSPLHTFKNKFLLKWHKKWEENCLNTAEKVCFTSKKAIALYSKRYPTLSHKFLWYPNTYDKNDLKTIRDKHIDKLKIVYTGGLVGKRSVEWLIPVFDMITQMGSEISESIEFIFAGEMDRYNQDIIRSLKFPFVKHIGVISYQESISLQLSAHILLIIDNPPDLANVGVFFPSKLLDYFLAQKPILAITSKDSSTNESLSNWHGACFEHNQNKETYNYIITMLIKAQKQGFKFFETPLPPVEFEASHNASRLFSDLKTVLATNN